tara:strand:- start:33 stop:440 length:408 start_codon:yes stop_codon:yes gene_type:complete
MFAFITVGTNNLKKSSDFYDQVLKILDIVKVDVNERYIGYAKEKKEKLIHKDGWVYADFYIMNPYNENEATFGNGTMITFSIETPDKVNQFHKKALELGAKNEGDPGPRHGEHHYAYFRDLDGNKICAFSITKSE